MLAQHFRIAAVNVVLPVVNVTNRPDVQHAASCASFFPSPMFFNLVIVSSQPEPE